MGTIIEFPADAASRRPGAAVGGAAGDGKGTVLILPVIRVERVTEQTDGGRGPAEGRPVRRRRRRRG